MEIKDIHEIKNSVFDRKELQAKIISNVTPSNKDVAALLSKKLFISEDSIKIKGIYGKFGLKEFKVKANIYPSKEGRNKIERKTKKEMQGEKNEAEATKKEKEKKE